jgi:hypothetical protein
MNITKNKKLVNIFIIFLISFLLILLLEIILRNFHPQKYIVYRKNSPKLLEFDNELGLKNNINTEGYYVTGEGDSIAYVKINKNGLRDIDYDYEKKKNISRVLVLGDSFVWGYGVNQNEVFTEIIERKLKNIEIINAGVPGYSTDQELIWFQDEGLKYKPDLTILVISPNDFDDIVAFNTYKPRFVIKNNTPFLMKPLSKEITRKKYSFWDNFFIYSFLRMRWDNFFSTKIEDYNNYTEKEKLELMKMILDKIRISSHQISSKFLIVIFDESEDRENFFQEYGIENNVSVLNLKSGFKEFREKNPDINIYFNYNPHWNQIGHKVVADLISEYLIK